MAQLALTLGGGVLGGAVAGGLGQGPPLDRKGRPRRPAKLDLFKAYIEERLVGAAPEKIPAKVLLDEIRALGCAGGYTMVKTFVASTRPAAEAEPVVRFETAPGAQMQVDWATIRRGRDRLSGFVATLGWSRAAYVEFVTDERVETLMACHEHAFPGVWWGAAGGSVRQRQDGGDRPRRLWAGIAFTPGSPTLAAIGGSGRVCAVLTGPGPRAR